MILKRKPCDLEPKRCVALVCRFVLADAAHSLAGEASFPYGKGYYTKNVHTSINHPYLGSP